MEAYDGIEFKIGADTSDLDQQLASLKPKMVAAGNSAAAAAGMSATKMNIAYRQAYANMLQGGIIVSRAIRRILMFSMAPIAAVGIAAFKEFGKASTVEIAIMQSQIEKLRDNIRNRLADAFYYAATSSKIFGKTGMEWLQQLSDKMNDISQNDVKEFVAALKGLAVAITTLKIAEMFLMTGRYIAMATNKAVKFRDVLMGVGPETYLAGRIGFGRNIGRVPPIVGPQQGRPGAIALRAAQRVLPGVQAGVAAEWATTGAMAAGAKWIKPIALAGGAGAAATGLAKLASGIALLGTALLFVGKLAIIAVVVTLLAALVSGFSKAAGYSGAMEMFSSLFSKIGEISVSVFKRMVDLFDQFTDRIAILTLEIGRFLKLTSKTEADYYREKEEGKRVKALERIQVISPLAQQQYAKTLQDYVEGRKKLTGQMETIKTEPMGFGGQTVGVAEIGKYMQENMQSWTKEFIDRQNKLIEIEDERKAMDKEFTQKAIELQTQNLVSLKEAAAELKKIGGTLSIANQAGVVFNYP